MPRLLPLDRQVKLSSLDYESNQGGDLMEKKEKENRLSANMVTGVLLIAVAGISVATETMDFLGLGGNYIYIACAALIIGVLLIHASTVNVVMVLIGIVIANLPDTNLQMLGVNRDIVLALVGALILAPAIYRLSVH